MWWVISSCDRWWLSIISSQTGNLLTNRPYFHPAIVTTLKELIFEGPRGTQADKHKHRFMSSIKEGRGKDELELPSAMVSLAATSVSFAPRLVVCRWHLVSRYTHRLVIGTVDTGRSRISMPMSSRTFITGMRHSLMTFVRQVQQNTTVWWLIYTTSVGECSALHREWYLRLMMQFQCYRFHCNCQQGQDVAQPGWYGGVKMFVATISTPVYHLINTPFCPGMMWNWASMMLYIP